MYRVVTLFSFFFVAVLGLTSGLFAQSIELPLKRVNRVEPPEPGLGIVIIPAQAGNLALSPNSSFAVFTFAGLDPLEMGGFGPKQIQLFDSESRTQRRLTNSAVPDDGRPQRFQVGRSRVR